jgi:hypothetical protein
MPTYKVMTLDYSDGKEVMHPANTTQPPPDADGTWEFYREVDTQESKGVLWLTKVAAALVDEYTNSGDGREYILGKLPKGYKLFEHVKRKKVWFILSYFRMGWALSSKSALMSNNCTGWHPERYLPHWPP